MKRSGSVFVVLVVFLSIIGCTSTNKAVNSTSESTPIIDDGITNISYKEIPFSEIKVNMEANKNTTTWDGLIVNAYVRPGSTNMYQNFLQISDKLTEGFTNISTAHDDYGNFKYQKLNADQFKNVLRKIDTNKLYKVYIAVYQGKCYITKVEGILTDAEVEAEKAAKITAENEANKYNPKDFAYFIDDFKPAKY
mgnify:FL=1